LIVTPPPAIIRRASPFDANRPPSTSTATAPAGRRADDVAENTPSNQDDLGDESSIEDLGLQLSELTAGTLRRLGLEDLPPLQGVLITNVDQNSLAFREAELRRGDIITEIDREQVGDLRAFERAYRSIDKGDTFLVKVMRQQPDNSLRPFLTALIKPE
jgi:serine protease Do